MKVCKMNEKYNNVWMSIRLLVNEYLKMNGNVWKCMFSIHVWWANKDSYIFIFSFISANFDLLNENVINK